MHKNPTSTYHQGFRPGPLLADLEQAYRQAWPFDPFPHPTNPTTLISKRRGSFHNADANSFGLENQAGKEAGANFKNWILSFNSQQIL